MREGPTFSIEGNTLSVSETPIRHRLLGVVLAVVGTAGACASWWSLHQPHIPLRAFAGMIFSSMLLILGLLLFTFASFMARAATFHFDRAARLVRCGNGEQLDFSAVSHLEIADSEDGTELHLVDRQGNVWIIYAIGVLGSIEVQRLSDEITRFTGINARLHEARTSPSD